MALAKLSNREAQIIRHLCRRHRFKGNLPLRQVGKKVIGIAAVVIDDTGLYRCCVRASLNCPIRAL